MAKQKIGFIGLGSMGQPMAIRLVQAGFPVAVYNRTRAKSEEVGKVGARVAESPKDAATGADVILMSLADQNIVTAMVFGEQGVIQGLRKDGYIVDMSTVSPGYARDLADKATKAGVKALDACVLGSPKHAAGMDGGLRFMVGGAEADVQAIMDIFNALGKEVMHLGANGLGATMKIMLNMLMGIEMQALAEAVVFGERAGLPRDKILKMINGSGYSSPVMNFRCTIMERRAFQQVAFKLALMRKDMMLVLKESQELGVPLPAAESAYTMLTAATQRGLGEYDCAAILAFMEQLSGLEGKYPPASAGGPPGAGGPPPGMGGRPPGAGGPPPGMGGPPPGKGPPSGRPSGPPQGGAS